MRPPLLLLLLLAHSLPAAELATAPVAARRPAALPAGISETSPGQWTWAGGPDLVSESERLGVYGTKGVPAPENVPGARYGAAAWVDGSGSFWLFGGRGLVRNSGAGVLNDLWKWDGAIWTWVSGSAAYGSLGVYGERGVAAPGNVPGARYGAVSWTDAAGNLWLFGGEGRGSVSSFDVRLSDLWKWDGTDWTWVAGPDVGGQPGIYGSLGVAAPENRPGARSAASAWADAAGNLWLFGGNGFGATSSRGDLNDLWRWDGASWTWMGGANAHGAPGVYGTKGLPAASNVPGGRSGAAATVGPDGNTWLFGGYGKASSGTGWLNDLWRWDGAAWTWMSGASSPDQAGVYGTKGIADPSNVPGARSGAVSWFDADGRLLLLGGLDDPGENDWEAWNDLWRWDGATWTWVGGASTADQAGTYGIRNLPAPGNEPGARYLPAIGRGTSGSVIVFGGFGSSATGKVGELNDLWRWDGDQWAWLAGSTGTTEAGVYGTRGVASTGNLPGARTGAVTWRGSGGEVWLFGGYGYSARGQGYLNDLWRWDGSTWTWMSGADTEGQPGVYGTKGVSAPTNVPGARADAAGWTDAAGNLWLFGGVDDPWEQSIRNDLWKWDGVSWTWVSGSKEPGHPGVYGTRGVPAPANVPPCRRGAASWTDAGGKLWLFGGSGWPVSPGADLNDLWRWDGTNWTWMHGANDGDVSGYAVALGVPAPENTPGGRMNAATWRDQEGRFWLFGGTNYSYWYQTGDLWRWDGANWTWMSGSLSSEAGVYGTLGVAAPDNVPGSRYGSSAWTDANGLLWLFGGRDVYRSFNDLWRWDGASWTWMSGQGPTQPAVAIYGDLGVPAPTNTPGWHAFGAFWPDAQHRFWLWGGDGSDATGARGTLRDLWVYEPVGCAPPSATITAPDSILDGSGAHGASVPDAGIGAEYEWTATGGTIEAGQGTPTISFSASPGEASVILAVVVRKSGCAASSTKSVPVGLYHRLDVIRIGTGSDLVVSYGSERQISCGLACAAVYAHGATVTLYAYPGSVSRFVGWLGGGCTGTGSCTVTMDEAKTVSATFFPLSATGFYTVTPCRVVDTRNAPGPWNDVPGPWSAPALTAGTSRAFTIGGECGVPADAAAVALNVTVTAPTDGGSLTLYPGTGPAPETTTIHFPAGRTRANNVTMGLAGGVLSVLDRQETGTVELIIDVNGYFR